MPGLTDDEIRAWLLETNVARLGTLNDDGSPRVTALWYLARADGTITLNTYEDNVHVENLRRDPRAALLVDSCEQPYRSVHFNGIAEVSEEAATAEEIARLYERYLGGAEAARAYGQQLIAGGKRVSIRFTAERQHSIDFGKLAA
ncbi:MAG: TIGR03618 family F420-dependent PPOX class oxidoreductase [Candidatus Limnocylindria bacterium]